MIEVKIPVCLLNLLLCMLGTLRVLGVDIEVQNTRLQEMHRTQDWEIKYSCVYYSYTCTLQIKKERRVLIDNRAGNASLSMMTSRKINEPSSIRSNIPDKGFPFSCYMCQTSFSEEKVYRAHMDGHKRLHCSFCGKPYQNPGRLSQHEDEHRGLFKFKCRYCEKGFNHKHDYRRHVERHERQNAKKVWNTVV